MQVTKMDNYESWREENKEASAKRQKNLREMKNMIIEFTDCAEVKIFFINYCRY